jgi:hypothetical protein
MSKTTDLPNQAEYADDCFFIPFVITLVGWLPSLIAATGERVAPPEDCRVAWNSTSDYKSLPLTQVGNAATDKQNGEGRPAATVQNSTVEYFLISCYGTKSSRHLHCSACRSSQLPINAQTGEVKF